MNDLKQLAIKKLNERGVQLNDISKIIYDLQKKYIPELTLDYCLEVLEKVLEKKEVTYAVLTGIAIDEAAENGCLNGINNVIFEDNSLYGIDEILALSIVNVHGSIALTNFGYLDKTKPGIIRKLDELGKDRNKCHTFLDDIICALASASASRMAHELLK